MDGPDLDRVLHDLSDIPLTTEPALVRQKSRTSSCTARC